MAHTLAQPQDNPPAPEAAQWPESLSDPARFARWVRIYRAELALRGLPPDTSSAMAAMEATGVAAILEASAPWTP